MLRALIARTFGITVRKRRIVTVDGEGEGRREMEVTDSDGAREVGWFIQGKKGEVIITR